MCHNRDQLLNIDLSLFRSLSHSYTSMRRGSVSRRFRVVSCVSRLRRLIAVGKSHTELRYLGRFASSLSVWPCSYFSCLFVAVAAVHRGAQGDGERRGPPPHLFPERSCRDTLIWRASDRAFIIRAFAAEQNIYSRLFCNKSPETATESPNRGA